MNYDNYLTYTAGDDSEECTECGGFIEDGTCTECGEVAWDPDYYHEPDR